MTTHGSKNWSNGNRLYWENHVKLIQLLATIGPKLSVTTRLDLFRFRYSLASLYHSEVAASLIEQALAMMDELVFERMQGWEPAHKNGRYL